MSAWAEVRALQEELYNVQLKSAVNKLSERNCVAVVQKLISLGLVDVLFSCDGKEYITPRQLERDILDEVIVSGGRCALTDLAQTLNVDYNHIDNKVKDLLSRDLTLHYGELISREYFDNLAEEINETLQETGILPLSELSRDVSLPVSTIASELLPRIGTLIQGTYEKSTDTLYTTAFVERQMAKLRGACSAATRPIQLGRIMESHGISPSLGHTCIKTLLSEGRVKGQLQGQASNPVFIPNLYTSAQNQWADSFYQQNGYMTFSMLSNKGIDNSHTFSTRFASAVQVPSGVISEGNLANIAAIVEEGLTTNGFTEVIEWSPEWCNEPDIEKILSLTLSSMVESESRRLPGNCVLSVPFLNTCLDWFNAKINAQVEKDVLDPKVLQSMKKFESAPVPEPAKAKKGGKGKKGKRRGGDDEEEYAAPKPTIGPTYLSAADIEAELQTYGPFEEVKEDGTLGEVAELLKRQLDEKYSRALDTAIRARTQKSSKSQQQEIEQTINTLYNTVILCEKGLKAFQEQTKVQIEKHILKSVCSELISLTFNMLAEEYGCPIRDADKVQPQLIIPHLPRNVKPIATSTVNAQSTGSNVSEFIEQYTALTDPAHTQLLVKRLDKKKERQMIFSQRQSLLEQLKSETSAANILNIGCALVFMKQHNTLLHAPGKCMSGIVTVISEGLSEAQQQTLQSTLKSVVSELKGEGEMGEEDKEGFKTFVTDVLFNKPEE